MYIDNNFQNPFATPRNGFATPAPGFQQPVASQAQISAEPVVPVAPVAPVAPPAPAERPEGFIEGWDDFEGFDFSQNAVQIKVFGVGGGGNNAVNRMYLGGEKSAEMVVVNTDIPVLRSSPVKNKVAIGRLTTRGHGAGASPEKGKDAAEESIDLIKRMLGNVDMLYITAGMGGGTGTGASPVIARVARELGILTVAVVTKPFEFEGGARMAQAEDGINKLRQTCDAVIVVPNERLLTLSNGKPLEIKEAFRAADEILIKGVQSICRLINDESYINLDFADLTAILRNSGDAHIGVGIAYGENKALLAAEQAINSPLLETSIKDADGIIISIIASETVSLDEINEANHMINGEASPNARIIWGLKFAPEMEDGIEITVIATKSGGAREIPVAPTTPAYVPVAPVVPTISEEPEEAPAPFDNEFVDTPTVAEPTPAPTTQPTEPVTVKPQDSAPATRNPSFISPEDFLFLQKVAMRKNFDIDEKK